MKVIQLAYRKIISSENTSLWEQYIFDDTYREFLMQAQFYNPGEKYQTFSQLSAAVPGAEKLHFLVSTAATGYISQLNNIIPDVRNTLGKKSLPFHLYRFEIIDSDIRNKKNHRIAIIFYSEPVQWLDTINDRLLISLNTRQNENDTLLQTELIKLESFISIHSLQITNHAAAISSQNILS